MPMIGAHGNLVIGTMFTAPASLFFEESTNYPNHVRTAAQMFRFKKRTIGLASHLAKMGKMDLRAKFADHGEQVIVRSRSVRPDAERKAIWRSIVAEENPSCIIRSRNYTRQTEEWPWRIIGMNS